MDTAKKYYLNIILDGLGPLVLLADIIPIYFLPRWMALAWMVLFSALVCILNLRFIHRRYLYPFLMWGLIASSVVAFRYAPLPDVLPQGLSKVTALEGILDGDGRLTKGGNYIYELRVEKIQMGNMSIDYPYPTVVFARGQKGYWGEKVRFDKVRLGKDGRSFSAGKTTMTGGTSSFYKLRKRAVIAFTEKINLVYGKKSFLAEALLTGSRDNLESDLKEMFRKGGVSHVLALSGMHLGIIALFVHFLVSRFAGPRLAIVMVNAVNLLYLLLAGLSPSLLRAVIMFFLASVGKFMGQKINLMRILVFTFTVSLMAFPAYFFSLSFQLSFLALAGLLLLTVPITSILERCIPSTVATLAACSIGAVIMTSAVSFYNFGVVYPSGIITSMVISPVVTLYMCLGLGLMLLPSPFFTAIHLVQQHIFTFLYHLIYKIVELAALLPGITAGGRLPFLVLMVLQLAIIVLLWRIRRFK